MKQRFQRALWREVTRRSAVSESQEGRKGLLSSGWNILATSSIVFQIQFSPFSPILQVSNLENIYKVQPWSCQTLALKLSLAPNIYWVRYNVDIESPSIIWFQPAFISLIFLGLFVCFCYVLFYFVFLFMNLPSRMPGIHSSLNILIIWNINIIGKGHIVESSI